MLGHEADTRAEAGPPQPKASGFSIIKTGAALLAVLAVLGAGWAAYTYRESGAAAADAAPTPAAPPPLQVVASKPLVRNLEPRIGLLGQFSAVGLCRHPGPGRRHSDGYPLPGWGDRQEGRPALHHRHHALRYPTGPGEGRARQPRRRSLHWPIRNSPRAQKLKTGRRRLGAERGPAHRGAACRGRCRRRRQGADSRRPVRSRPLPDLCAVHRPHRQPPGLHRQPGRRQSRRDQPDDPASQPWSRWTRFISTST